MTLLAADIGNSHTVLGLLHDGAVLDHWRVATDERRTPDEWAVLIRGLLAESSVADPISGIAVCATVPSVLYAWRDMLARHFVDVPACEANDDCDDGDPCTADKCGKGVCMFYPRYCS